MTNNNQQTEMHKRFITGFTWQMLGGLLFATITVTSTLVMGFNGVEKQIEKVTNTLNARIDTIKYNQMERAHASDIHFTKIDDKLDNINEKLSKKR